MLEDFKADLHLLSSTQLIRKYIYNGSCNVLNDDKHYQLKEEICEHLKIEFNDVVLVGSAKLGFSIKPSKRFAAFGEESDIDVAVVSKSLFERIWEEAFLYKKSGADWPAASSFFKYLSQGWIRPDKLPSSDYFTFTATWWNFFNGMTSSRKYGPYIIRAGLYHSSFFLQEYQKICIEQCIEELG
jgi:hypothetical protein